MKKKKNRKIVSDNIRIFLGIFLIVIGLFILPRIPYANLYLDYSMTILITIGIVVTVQFKSTRLIIASIILLILSLFLTYLNSNYIAEIFGNVTFFVMLTFVIIQIKEIQ